MSSSSELAELHHLIGGLRRCVASLKSKYGDGPSMRRVVNDTERILNDIELLEIDAAELELAASSAVPSGEKIAVPDTDYHRDFWAGVDDEGVGGHGRSR